MAELLVFPCNGNAVEALDCLAEGQRLLGFVDDDAGLQGSMRHGVPVYGRDAFARWPDAQVLAVPGSPDNYQKRRAIVETLGIDAPRYARLVHPSARVSPLARLGRNVLIMAGVVITANAVIGDHVCVLPNSVIHHDVRVGDWTLIGSNVSLAGHVTLGENCYVGSGTSVLQRITIGDGALVGLASTVIRPVERGSRVAGSPARLLV